MEPETAGVVTVVSPDPRVGRALVAYLSTGVPEMTVVGPLTYGDLGATDQSDVDAVVCDLDGSDLAAALNWVETLTHGRDMTVIAVSSNASARRRAVESGASSSVDKSADVDRLARHVRATAPTVLSVTSHGHLFRAALQRSADADPDGVRPARLNAISTGASMTATELADDPADIVWLLVVNYTAPLERIDALLPAHVRFLDRNFASGYFLASGPQHPRLGGVILARARDRDHLDQIVASDPFVRAGAATYSVVTFTPTRGPLVAALLDGQPDSFSVRVRAATTALSHTNSPDPTPRSMR